MSTIGALAGLLLAILLIIKKVPAAYGLILGAVVAALLGGNTLPESVTMMIDGVKDITPAIIRIITAGVLSGLLIKTGAAESISSAIVRNLGKRHVFFALALATMLLTAIGVFIDVAVITVAPIALMIGRQMSLSRLQLLFVMVGGGKCGNIISPNPNTIIAAENFGAELSSVMFVNLIPAIIGLFIIAY
ncbi:MAG: SLC13 family permease, partial [Bacteroidales bacterium]